MYEFETGRPVGGFLHHMGQTVNADKKWGPAGESEFLQKELEDLRC